MSSDAELLPLYAALSPSAFLFLEARLIGANALHNEYVSQLGLSLRPVENLDVTLLTRTSGFLLVAGVGSYCAYRLGRRWLGNNFVWTCWDATRCDLLARADSRLLHPAAEGFYTVRIGEDDLTRIRQLLQQSNASAATTSDDTLPDSEVLDASDGSSASRNVAHFQALVKRLAAANDAKRQEGGLAAILCIHRDRKYHRRKHKRTNRKCVSNTSKNCAESNPLCLWSDPEIALTSHAGFGVPISAENNAIDTTPATTPESDTALGVVNAATQRRRRLRTAAAANEKVADTDTDDCASCCSDITSVSRRRPARKATIVDVQQPSTSLGNESPEEAVSVVRAPSTASASASSSEDEEMEALSASLRIIWRNAQPSWDDDDIAAAMAPESGAESDAAAATPSIISQLSAFKTLQRMFRQKEGRRRNGSGAASVASSNCGLLLMANRHNSASPTPSIALRSTTSPLRNGMASDASSGIFDASATAELIREKCFADNPAYLYRSAVIDDYRAASSTCSDDGTAASRTSSSALRWTSSPLRRALKATTTAYQQPTQQQDQLRGLWEFGSPSPSICSQQSPEADHHHHFGRCNNSRHNSLENADADSIYAGIRTRMSSASPSVERRRRCHVTDGGMRDVKTSMNYDNRKRITSMILLPPSNVGGTAMTEPPLSPNAMMFDSAIAMTESVSTTASSSYTTSNSAFPRDHNNGRSGQGVVDGDDEAPRRRSSGDVRREAKKPPAEIAQHAVNKLPSTQSPPQPLSDFSTPRK